MKEQKICAFTGHRPSKLPWRYDETDSRCVALKAVLAEQITALAEAGSTLNYARKMGREIIVIDPVTHLISCGEASPIQFQ